MAEKNNGRFFADGSLAEKTINKELRPLNELIDVMNIHGWVAGKSTGCGSPLCLFGHQHFKRRSLSTFCLGNIAFQFGQKHALEADSDASDAYRKIDDSLLNGMPCDRVNVLTEQDVDRTSWQQEEDIHAPFWEAVSGDPKVYYQLRRKIMEGMLKDTKLHLDSPDENHYSIYR